MVSILMPTLNEELLIERSISAILDQSFSDFELLVLDGGSTDNTLSYVKSLNDSRVQVYTNCGSIVDSLNRGIKESRGKYIARADADSIPDTNWLGTCIKFLSNNAEYAAVGTQAKRVYEDGTSHSTSKPVSDDEIRKTLVWSNPMIHPTIVIRKTALKEVGGYRYRHWEDYDLVVRLSKENKLSNIPEVLVVDHVREDGIVASTGELKSTAANLYCAFLALAIIDYSYTKMAVLGVRRTVRAVSLFLYNTLVK